jgi:cytochrome c551/c552
MRRAAIRTAAGIAAVLFQSLCFAEVDATWAQGEAREHGCLKFHAIDTTKVGPPYQSVSAKFKGKSVEEVRGSMKGLPVHQGVLKKTNDQELKGILEWILTL